MEDPALKNRRRKNDDVVVLDDAPSPTQPPLKSVRREEDVPENRQNDVAGLRNGEESGQQSVVSGEMREPELVPSSPEVLELRQLLIASKQQQLNLEQQLVNASQMLVKWEQQTARKEEMYQRACQTAREAELRAEQAEKQLEEEKKEKRWAYEREDGYKKQLEKERNDRRRAYERVNQLEDKEKRAYQLIGELTKEVEEEKKKVSEREKRIEQLKRKLAGDEAGEPEVVEIDDAPAYAGLRFGSRMDKFAHPTNISHLVSPAISNSISLDEAVKRVRGSFEKCGEKARKRCKEKATNFDCRLCGFKIPNKLVATTHFLSEEHIGQVHASGSSVSKTAISNWANMLDNLADWGKA